MTPGGGRPGNGFLAEYFRNRDLAGRPEVVRVEERIDLFDEPAPLSDAPRDNFSARWTGQLVAPVSGRYTFTFAGDDGYRLSSTGSR